MIKRFAAVLLLTLSPGLSWATYTNLRDASLLNRGTLSNFRLDPTSVTLGGAQLIQDVANLMNSTSTISTNITNLQGGKNSSIIISTGSGVTSNYSGLDRTPFVGAIAEIVAGTRAKIHVKRGTYTVENIVSDGIDWDCEAGATFRRANNNMMFKIRNGSIINATFISTAVGATAITTPAIVMDDNSRLYGVRFELAQDNRQGTGFQETNGFIDITSRTNVVIDNLYVSTFSNLYQNSNSRNCFLGIANSTGIIIQNSYFGTSFSGTNATLDGALKFRNSDVLIRNNWFETANNISIFGVDKTGFLPSRFTISGNTIKDNGSGVGIEDATFSSGSVIIANTIISNSPSTIGIILQGGGLGNSNATMWGTLVSNNNMQSFDGQNKGTGIFCEVNSDIAKLIGGVGLIGNSITQINTFESESAATVNTVFRSNRKNGIMVTDQN